MRLLLIIAGMLIASAAFSQKDSLPPIPDSIQYISQRHIQQAYKNLSEKLKPLEDKLTVSQYNKLIEGIEAAYNEVIIIAGEEYRKRKKK
jgi:hypothetical protein